MDAIMNGPSPSGLGADAAAFLAAHGLADAAIAPLAGDASARRYRRLTPPGGGSLILVETPAPADDLLPFIAVGALLEGLGFSVPAVRIAAAQTGLAVLEDFGDATFSRLLDAGADPWPLYELATDVLVALHRGFDAAAAPPLPLYDARLFVGQVMLFADVYVPAATGRTPTDAERAALEAAWTAALEPVCAGPCSLLLRDYHAENLMRLDRPGVRAAGLLDFQSAGIGPTAYDLVSLLEDARRDVPDALAAAMIARYLERVGDGDGTAFRHAYTVLGAVRHARVLAVFTRLAAAGKTQYRRHGPRVWRLFERHLAHPGLAAVAAWIDRHLPPAARAAFFHPESHA